MRRPFLLVRSAGRGHRKAWWHLLVWVNEFLLAVSRNPADGLKCIREALPGLLQAQIALVERIGADRFAIPEVGVAFARTST